MTGKECAHGIERWNVCREALRAGASVRPAEKPPGAVHGEEDPQEERAEAAALFAEYAIDFAAQGVRSALLAALAAMDQQMKCEEQQGKEHPV